MNRTLLFASAAIGALACNITVSNAQMVGSANLDASGQYYAGTQRGAAIANMEFARTLRRHVVIQPPTENVPDAANSAAPLFYGPEGDLGSTRIQRNGKYGADVVMPEVPASVPLTQNQPEAVFTPYVTYFGNQTDYETTGSKYGEQYSTNGVIVGGNVDFGQYIPYVRLAQTGIAGGYSKTDYDAFGLPGGATADNYHIGAYSTLEAPYFDVASAASYGYSRSFTQRANGFGVFGQGNDIHTIAFSSEASVNALAFALPLPLADRLTLAPVATFDYSQTFFEGGSDGGVNVYDNDQANFVAGVGLKAGGQYNFAGNVVGVEARVLYEHGFEDNGYATFLSNPTSGLTTQASGPGGQDDRVAVGFAASTRIAQGVTASVRYDGAYSKDVISQGFSGLVGFTF